MIMSLEEEKIIREYLGDSFYTVVFQYTNSNRKGFLMVNMKGMCCTKAKGKLSAATFQEECEYFSVTLHELVNTCKVKYSR